MIMPGFSMNGTAMILLPGSDATEGTHPLSCGQSEMRFTTYTQIKRVKRLQKSFVMKYVFMIRLSMLIQHSDATICHGKAASDALRSWMQSVTIMVKNCMNIIMIYIRTGLFTEVKQPAFFPAGESIIFRLNRAL